MGDEGDCGFTQLVTTKGVEGRRSLLPALVIWKLELGSLHKMLESIR